MACACKNRRNTKYLWTPPEGTLNPDGTLMEPVEYTTQMEAKAKVMRKGGSYKPIEG